MKKHILSNLFLLALILLVFNGCEKEEIPINPKEAILGKWVITHLGNGNNLHLVEDPGAYREFLGDSVLHIYDFEDGSSTYRKYWIMIRF